MFGTAQCAPTMIARSRFGVCVRSKLVLIFFYLYVIDYIMNDILCRFFHQLNCLPCFIKQPVMFVAEENPIGSIGVVGRSGDEGVKEVTFI